MKTGRQHRVPLSGRGRWRFCETLPRLEGSPYVFFATAGRNGARLWRLRKLRSLEHEIAPRGPLRGAVSGPNVARSRLRRVFGGSHLARQGGLGGDEGGLRPVRRSRRSRSAARCSRGGPQAMAELGLERAYSGAALRARLRRLVPAIRLWRHAGAGAIRRRLLGWQSGRRCWQLAWGRRCAPRTRHEGDASAIPPCPPRGWRDVVRDHLARREERDSNPRDGSPPTHFPGVRLRPLGHLSGARREIISPAAAQARTRPLEGPAGLPRWSAAGRPPG